jgi:tetratricopeptide (TPR) repeat protein
LPALNWPGHQINTVRTVTFLYLPPGTAPPEYRVKAVWELGTPPPESVTVVTDDQHLVRIAGPTGAAPGREDSGERTPATPVVSSPPPHLVDMSKGEFLQLTGNVEGAIAMFRQAIQSEPNCAACHRVLADALLQKGDRDGAIVEYQETVRIEPDNAEYHFMLGAQLEARGATAAYTGGQFNAQTRSSRPGSPALSKTARADYQAALEQYGLAHQLAPQDSAYKDAYERMRGQLKRQ